MNTKNPRPPTDFAPRQTSPLVRLYYEFNTLKQLYRQGWLERGIPPEECESVGEHVFGVALLGLLIAERHYPDLDAEKIVKIALLHDLGEVYAGDITPGDGIPPQEKRAAELSAIQKIFRDVPNGETYIRLWKEYENGSSPEARLVKQIDRLEMALQASVYAHQGYENMQEFLDSAARAVEEPALRALLGEIEIRGGRPRRGRE